jgi:MarR family 2-MHQ and catechol resistance regulon transcriptional repressor
MREATQPRHGSGLSEATIGDLDDTQAAAESVLRASAMRYQDELSWADPDAIEAALALLRATRMHRTAAGRQIESLNLGVSMTGARFTLLLTLYFSRDNLLAQNEISRELSVSRTNVTNLIDGLERDGLVIRVPNPADRRVSYAQLTAEGEQLCVRLLPDMTQLMMDLTHGFTPGERLQLKDFLYRMQRNVATSHPGRYARGLGLTDPE